MPLLPMPVRFANPGVRIGATGAQSRPNREVHFLSAFGEERTAQHLFFCYPEISRAGPFRMLMRVGTMPCPDVGAATFKC